MTILAILNEHYSYLTPFQKKHYTQAEFTQNIEEKNKQYKQLIQSLDKKKPHWIWFIANKHHNQKLLVLHKKHQSEIKSYRLELKENNKDYHSMETDIRSEILKLHCFGYSQLLSNKEQELLSKHAVIDNLVELIDKKINNTNELTRWYNHQFSQHTPFHDLIEQRLHEYCLEKTMCFIKNNYFFSTVYQQNKLILDDLIALEKWSIKNNFYHYINNNASYNNTEPKSALYLSCFITPVLNEFTNQLHLPDLNLYEFNKKQATLIAHSMLHHEPGNNLFIKYYLTQLTLQANQLLDKQQQRIDWLVNPLSTKTLYLISDIKKGILSCSLISSTHQKAQEVADSLFLFNAAGGESELGFITNLWNVFRFKNMVKSGKNIGLSFLSLLKPIYEEFESVAHNNSCAFVKIASYLMPVLIAIATTLSLFIVSCSALPILTSTIPSLLIMIPLIAIGLFTASCYITLKTKLTHKLGNQNCLNKNNSLSLKNNARMVHAFGAKKSNAVQTLYTEEIKIINKKMALLSNKKKQGTLTEKELSQLNDLKQKELTVNQEWHVIHDDCNVGTDTLNQIVKNRFSQSIRESSLEKSNEFKKVLEKRIQSHSFFLYNSFLNKEKKYKKDNGADKKNKKASTSGYELLYEQYRILYT